MSLLDHVYLSINFKNVLLRSITSIEPPILYTLMDVITRTQNSILSYQTVKYFSQDSDLI